MNVDELEHPENIDDPSRQHFSGEVSELEKMCAEYISQEKPSPAFVDRLAKVFYKDERVRKICRVRSLKNKVSLDDFDEVMQRVMSIFFEKMLSKLREANAIYAVVYAIANNVSLEIIRETMEVTVNHDSLEEMMERGVDLEDLGVSAQYETDHDNEIDRLNANAKMATTIEKFMRGELKLSKAGAFSLDSLPCITLVPPSKDTEVTTTNGTTTLSAEVAKPQKGRRRKSDTEGGNNHAIALSPDQQELVDIRNKLKVRHQDYAVMLGIGLPRLSSYTYGRTASVPKDIMDAARKLLVENKKTTALAEERFSKPMSEILEGWCQLLGTDSNELVGQYLGVSAMTVHRWKANETKPDQTALNRYDRIVKTVAEAVEGAKTSLKSSAVKKKKQT